MLKKFCNPLISNLEENGCKVIGDIKVRKSYKKKLKIAKESDWRKEYLSSTVSVKTVKSIEEAINSCIGEFKYKLPKFSAIKIDGKKSYQLARSNKNFEPKERISSIKSIEIIDISKLSFEIIVKCSPGTYIRSLVDSIGETLTLGATVNKLDRIQSGPFYKKNS